MDTPVQRDCEGGQGPVVTFVDLSKEAAAQDDPVQPASVGRTSALFIAFAIFIMLFSGMGGLLWIVSGQRFEIQYRGPSANIMEDFLDDLLKAHMWEGVEKSDHGCSSCFFRDEGRVRRAVSSSEAFLVYQGDALQQFEIVTHVFDAHPHFVLGQAPQPFSFWTASDFDGDGQPDAWQPVAAQYRSEGSIMGWSRGVFHGQLPPAQAFVKVTLHDMPGAWRPQIGRVMIVGSISDPTPPQPTEQVSREDEGQDLMSFLDRFLEQSLRLCNRGGEAAPLGSIDGTEPGTLPTSQVSDSEIEVDDQAEEHISNPDVDVEEAEALEVDTKPDEATVAEDVETLLAENQALEDDVEAAEMPDVDIDSEVPAVEPVAKPHAGVLVAQSSD